MFPIDASIKEFVKKCIKIFLLHLIQLKRFEILDLPVSKKKNTCIYMDGFRRILYIYIYIKFRRRRWHPTPVLLPGKSHGWRSLVGCSPWGHEESDTTEQLHLTFHFHALEKEMGTHSSVLAWRIPGMGEPSGHHLWGCTELDTTEATQQQQQHIYKVYIKKVKFIPRSWTNGKQHLKIILITITSKNCTVNEEIHEK